MIDYQLLMNIEQNQIHLIKSILCLKKIGITVRFPCSISFALKHQNNIVDHKAAYQLLKGECLIDKTIEIQIQIPYVLGRYQQRKMSLLVYMVSSNGKIPAGSVTICPTQKLIVDRKVALEKCPDKNAFAVYTLTYERSRTVKNIYKGLSNLASSTVSGYNQVRRSHIYPTTFKGEQERNSQKNLHSPRYQIENQNKFRTDSKQQMRESLGATSSEKRINQRPPNLRLNDLGRKSSYGSINKQTEQKQSRLANRMIGDQNQWEVQAQKSRILKLQQQKIAYMKQISKLRGSRAKIEVEDREELQQQINRMNNQKGNLQEQVEDLRQKTKYQQRRQNQSNGLMKQLREQLDKKKSRIILLDSSKNQIQGQLSEKDRIIHDLQNQKKKILESLQEEKSLQLSQQKRLQIKENSFREQLKKLNEKIIQIDAQRQKAILNYSDLLNQFQASQKKHQTAIRDKQKSFNEEKVKLSKKNDQLVAQNIGLKQKMSEDNIWIRDYQYLKKKLTQDEKSFTQKVNDLNSQNSKLTNEIASIQLQNNQLKNQLTELQQVHNSEKNSLKKKCLQLNHQLQTLKQKMEKSNMIHHSYQYKYKDLQAKLAAQVKQKAIILADLQATKKIHQKYIQEEQLKQKLAETLSVQNMSYNQKLNQYRNRVDLQKRKYQTMEAKYEEQVKYLIGSKDLISNQIEQLRWMLEKQMEKSQTFALKNAELGDLGERLIDVNQQIIVFEGKFNIYQQQKEESNKKIVNLQSQIDNYEHKMRLQQDTLQRYELDSNKIQRKNQQFQQENGNLQQRLLNMQAGYKQKIQALQRKIQDKNIKIKTKDQELQGLRRQLSNAMHQASKQISQFTHLNHDISSLKDTNKTLKRDYNTIISKYQSISQQERQAKKKVTEVEQSLHLSNQQLQNCNRILDKTKSQFQQYKAGIYKSLEQLFQFISRQQFGQKNQLSVLHSLPDQKLFKIQVESLKKYQTIRRNLQKETESFKNEAVQLKQQLSKLQNINDKMQDQIMLKIKFLQDQLNQQQEQKRKIIDQYQTQISQLNTQLQEKRNEIQYLSNEINGYQSAISQFNEQISQKQTKEALLTRQVNQLQKTIFEYKQKQMKEKLLSSDQVLDCQQILKLERQHNQQQTNNLKAQLEQKQRQIAIKNQQIRKLSNQSEQLQLQQKIYAHQIQNLKRQIELTQSSKLIVQNQLKEKQKIINQIRQQLNESRIIQAQQKSKSLFKEQEITRLQSEIQGLQQKICSYKEQKENKSIKNDESSNRQKQKRQKLQLMRVKIEQQNKQIRQKCVKLQSQNEFYRFYKEENSKKLEEYEKLRCENLSQIAKCRQLLLRYERQRQEYENKYYQIQIELQNATKEKQLINNTNNKLKQRIAQYQEQCRQLYRTISELQSKDKEIGRLQQANKSIQNQHDRIINELRQSSHKIKQELIAKNIRIKQLQQLISNHQIELNSQKQKWQVELDNQKNIYHLKLQTLDQNMQVLQNQLQFQREQSVKEIEGANAIIQELNQVVRQKEEQIQYKEEIINEQNVRLEELNTQLNQCITKWEKEKQTYLPNSTKMIEIKDEIARMNTFIGELDGRNKQLLQINKRKMQQTIQNKPNLTEILKDLLTLLNKNKTKILNRCQTQKQKEAVVVDFKAIQQKIDLTLKSTQIVSVKQ